VDEEAWPTTNAVVAICVVLVSAAAVVEMGAPVNVGLANGANPLIDAPEGIVTVPVKVGEAKGASVVSVG
jgi:hypothetical protein